MKYFYSIALLLLLSGCISENSRLLILCEEPVELKLGNEIIKKEKMEERQFKLEHYFRIPVNGDSVEVEINYSGNSIKKNVRRRHFSVVNLLDVPVFIERLYFTNQTEHGSPQINQSLASISYLKGEELDKKYQSEPLKKIFPFSLSSFTTNLDACIFGLNENTSIEKLQNIKNKDSNSYSFKLHTEQGLIKEYEKNRIYLDEDILKIIKEVVK
jgi:hypothetical protein